MGITEYVAARHTFGILICVIHDGINLGTLSLARRLHTAGTSVCGLYAHATTTTDETLLSDYLISRDTLCMRIAQQYRIILNICASGKTTLHPLIYIDGPSNVISAISNAFPSVEISSNVSGHNIRIAISEPGIDDACIRNYIADILIDILLRLTGSISNSTGR